MYSQPLYYNQYYVPPYTYAPDQAYHAHLLASNPAYRQQYEERQRQADKKAEGKDREVGGKEEWKQKASVPPTLSRAPSLTDLGNKGGLNPAKPKEPPGPSEQAKSVIMAKGEESKAPAPPQEGLKMKLSEAGHHGKEEAKAGAESARATGVEPAMWYRQHQGYMPYMHGAYGYSQGYEPSHPGYRGMPSVMMQGYPGSYLPAGYSFSSYAGGKVGAGEEGEKPSRSSPTVKPPGEAKALDLLQQHASQYKSKSPSLVLSHRRQSAGVRPVHVPPRTEVRQFNGVCVFDFSAWTSGPDRPGPAWKTEGPVLLVLLVPGETTEVRVDVSPGGRSLLDAEAVWSSRCC
ncbi:hypothetical protein INR49_009400 [Caranx melampygus]|nr:hypothetical protein INR49_009400 [Caranx melampygus]